MEEIVKSSATLEQINKISRGTIADTQAVLQFEALVKVAQLSKT